MDGRTHQERQLGGDALVMGIGGSEIGPGPRWADPLAGLKTSPRASGDAQGDDEFAEQPQGIGDRRDVAEVGTVEDDVVTLGACVHRLADDDDAVGKVGVIIALALGRSRRP